MIPFSATDNIGVLEMQLEFWQRQLRLQDWDITVEWARTTEIGGCSNIQFTYTTHEARIRILHPSENGPPSRQIGHYDPEVFLVHELLHLTLQDWQGKALVDMHPKYIAKEVAIDHLAFALVRLARGEARGEMTR